MARLRRTAAGTSLKRLFIRTTSAASIAMSVPAPIAIPISARVRAGASLIPSPTMATLPCSLRERITLSLPSGRTPAMTSSTPAWAPIALAVRSLSPVSMTTRIPIFCNSLIACGLSSLMTSATAMMPASLPLRAKRRGVFPSSASFSAFWESAAGTLTWLLINFMLPPIRVSLSSTAESPFPGRAWKSVTSGAVR